MKRHATTLLLFLVAGGLALWLWLDRDKVTEGERKKRDSNVFPAWRRDDLSRIEIVHEGETIVIVRAGEGAWRMTSPRAERVDQAAAERLTTTLEFASVLRKVGEAANLGLEPPRASGSVTMGSIVFRFALGGPSPRPEGSSYFRIDDGAPFVASKELTETLLASSDTYRDRTVVPYLSLELARFELKHPGGGVVLERSDDRSFKIAGTGLLASRTLLDKVWGALAEMRAESFPKDADADRLTANPRLTIRMLPKEAGKEASELVVGDVCPGHPDDVVVLRRTPTRSVACAPKGALEALLAIAPGSLVDRRPFSFRHDEIEELRLEAVGGANGGATDGAASSPRVIELARRGTGFHQREPSDRDLAADEAEAVSELLAKIEQSTAEDVRPGGPSPFPAIARARVRAGDHEETVEIGPVPHAAAKADGGAAPGTVLIHRLRDNAELVVSPSVARRLVPRKTTTRPAILLGEARRVGRVVLRCGVTQEFVDGGSGLKLVNPSGYETDGSIVQLVDGLVRGKVIAWVADADDGSFGLEPDAPDAKEACSVALSFADGSAPVTIRFGDEGEGGVYGVVDGKADVFVASAALRDLAKRIYVSRAALRVDPSRIESVKVTRKGKAVTGGPTAEALREAVGALYADHASSLAPPNVGEVDVEITLMLAEAGPPKRITCGAEYVSPTGRWRRCAASGVKATFEVQPSLVDAFIRAPRAPDASTSAH